MSADRLEGLRAAVELSPGNHALRLVLAEAGERAEALGEFERLLAANALPADELVGVGELAPALGRLQLAARCLEAARRGGVVGGTAGLEEGLTLALVDGGVARRAIDLDEDDGEDAGTRVTDVLDEPAERVAFSDVGGLDDVKKAIHRPIVLPFQRPDPYERYGRRAGGGVLLFGPPGCGKTLLARATAGECGVPFLNLP